MSKNTPIPQPQAFIPLLLASCPTKIPTIAAIINPNTIISNFCLIYSNLL